MDDTDLLAGARQSLPVLVPCFVIARDLVVDYPSKPRSATALVERR